jgi:chromosome segregation ATPase
MARSTASRSERAPLERELARLRRDLAALERRLGAQDERVRRLSRAVEVHGRAQAVVSEALALRDPARKGDRGVVRELQTSIARLEEYLIKTSERIENILSALKHHRELLVAVNERVLNVSTRDRIRLELDVMKNTVSILALNGIEMDEDVVEEIEKLRASVPGAADLGELEKAKAILDKRFDAELKKFDLDAIWSKRKDIPGYV